MFDIFCYFSSHKYLTMFTLLGVLGTQELIIILSLLAFVCLLVIVPIITYRLGKKAGKLEALEMQRKNVL
jgi:hypothetical protein